jgi:hypothetical protein
MKKHLLILATALLSISTFAQTPNYVPSNGLIGWWPFNGNANDESGNGNHGTVNGATLTQDRFGNSNMAYGFDGVDDFISMLRNYQGSFSTSLWFNSNGNSQFKPLIDAFDVNWEIQIMNSFLAYVSFDNASNIQVFNSSVLITNNNWNNLICTFNSNVLNFYLNGTQINQFTVYPLPVNSGNYYLGASLTGSDQYLNGSLDDIGIWNRALTACEIQDLYHAQLGSQSISAGADQSICDGDNVTLNGAGGSNYQWNNNVVDGQAFTPSQSANYVVNGTDSLGCQGTDTVVVTVLENAVSTLTQTALDSYTLNGQTYTQSGTYTQTVPAANGCDSTITLNLTLNFTGIDELGTSAKKLVKITDLNGKIIPRRKNTLMLFIYEDGTVERVLVMD